MYVTIVGVYYRLTIDRTIPIMVLSPVYTYLFSLFFLVFLLLQKLTAPLRNATSHALIEHVVVHWSTSNQSLQRQSRIEGKSRQKNPRFSCGQPLQASGTFRSLQSLVRINTCISFQKSFAAFLVNQRVSTYSCIRLSSQRSMHSINVCDHGSLHVHEQLTRSSIL